MLQAIHKETDNRPWAQTHSGRAVPLVGTQASDIHWRDVAYALAHTNRFAGHAGVYSVAQHSILVADHMPPDWRVYGLLHDAHEFVTGDITTPVKRALEAIGSKWAFKIGGQCVGAAVLQLKSGLDAAIHEAAGLAWPLPGDIAEAVHIADIRALVTEKRDLLVTAPKPWGYEHLVPFSEKIVAWQEPAESYGRYLASLEACGIAVH